MPVILPARFLIDTDSPENADLIYILGGFYQVRAPKAAALFRSGRAPRILLAREVDPGNGMANSSDLTEAFLIRNGVPPDRITHLSFANGVRSTADEAHALRYYLNAHPASKVLIVTSDFHSRRARLAMTRAVPRQTKIVVVAAPDPECSIQTWDQTDFCRYKIKVEWEKLAFYFFTFFG